MGRKHTLNYFIKVMREVLEDDRTVVLTKKELFLLANSKLPKEKKISYETFRQWCTKPEPKSDATSSLHAKTLSDDIKEEFWELLEVAKINQKLNLTQKVLDPTSRNAFGAKYVLERKFEDMREQKDTAPKAPVIQISVGSKETQALIEGIVNNNIIDIPHEEVKNEEIEAHKEE